MGKITDSWSGKQKWIKGPGRKQDLSLSAFEPKSKLDKAADNYLRVVEKNSEISSPKQFKKTKTINKKLTKKKQKAIRCITNLKQHLNFIPLSKFDRISIMKSIENVKIRLNQHEN